MDGINLWKEEKELKKEGLKSLSILAEAGKIGDFDEHSNMTIDLSEPGANILLQAQEES